jgi:DNA-binding response OmpR family regulator
MMSTLKKVLLVDDDHDLCLLFKEELEEAGFAVLTAHCGNEAYKIYQVEKVDLVITDIKMPNGDGLELLKKIIASQRSVPAVVVMTGFSDFTEAEILKMGATKLYLKPLDIESLISDINHSLGLAA